MKHFQTRNAGCTLALFFLLALSGNAEEWTEFRGPSGQGRADVKSAPLQWSETSDNIGWKTPIDGQGWSSPVVADERIWLTASSEDGLSLRLIGLNQDTGKISTNVEVFAQDKALRIHSKNTHASPTPIVHGDRIFVHFGTYGTACVTLQGDVVWRQSLSYRHVHGPGGSPVLHNGLLFVSCDGGDKQFVAALDQKTGEEVWRTSRPENPFGKKFAFSTPTMLEIDGQWQVVSAGAGAVVAYDPKTGRELWNVTYPEGYSVVPRPIIGSGMVFVSSAFDRPTLYAIRQGGAGDITDSHVAWTLSRGAPHSPTPILVDDELYIVSDRGVASCVDAKTGEQHWQQRIGGNFSASPVFAAGRIYLLDENGKTTVIAPGTEFKELAVNELPGRTLATLGVMEAAVLLRTDTHLYRINAE